MRYAHDNISNENNTRDKKISHTKLVRQQKKLWVQNHARKFLYREQKKVPSMKNNTCARPT